MTYEITLKDKTFKIRFGMLVAEHLDELLGDGSTFDKTAALVSYAHHNYCKSDKNAAVVIDKQDVYAMLEDATFADVKDQAFFDEVAKVWQLFTDSPMIKAILTKVSEDVKDGEKKPKKKTVAGAK